MELRNVGKYMRTAFIVRKDALLIRIIEIYLLFDTIRQ